MRSEVRIGLAVGFGYLLGRRRKLGRVLTLAAAVAIGRASRNPGGLLRYGQELIESSPQLSNLSRLGGPLASAGRAAATSAASSGIEAVSGTLRSGADALRRRSAGGGQRDAADRDDEPAGRSESGAETAEPASARRGR
ncbi:hypothetical protein [Micromonospora sp. NPDC048830]|uniref:hypothetical protein n=1 Tax=Micromonospora sp. NPDC048830 TaxID=3364257 RepID=UPI0037136E24